MILLLIDELPKFGQYQLPDKILEDDAVDGHWVQPCEVEEFSDRFDVLGMLHMGNWNATLRNDLLSC